MINRKTFLKFIVLGALASVFGVPKVQAKPVIRKRSGLEEFDAVWPDGYPFATFKDAKQVGPTVYSGWGKAGFNYRFVAKEDIWKMKFEGWEFERSFYPSDTCLIRKRKKGILS